MQRSQHIHMADGAIDQCHAVQICHTGRTCIRVLNQEETEDSSNMGPMACRRNQTTRPIQTTANVQQTGDNGHQIETHNAATTLAMQRQVQWNQESQTLLQQVQMCRFNVTFTGSDSLFLCGAPNAKTVLRHCCQTEQEGTRWRCQGRMCTLTGIRDQNTHVNG